MGLAHRANLPASALPHGDERRVGIARAVAVGPKFLLLDEPAAGLDDAESLELTQTIASLRDELGCGVLLVEHDMRIIFRVCERIQVLDYGKSIAVGAPQEIREDQARGRGLSRCEGGTDCSGSLTSPCTTGGSQPSSNSRSRSTRGSSSASSATTARASRRRCGRSPACSGRARARSCSRASSIVGLSPDADRPARHRARAREPADLRPADRRREPPDRHGRPEGQKAGRGRHQEDLRALRGSRRPLRPRRVDALGRRAAAARDRAGPPLAAEAAPPRRADTRARAADRRPGVRDTRGAEARRA